MKKFILLFLILFLIINTSNAVPMNPSPFVYTQPNGAEIILHAIGDEYGHWIETEDKYVVVEKNGYYEYATIVNGEMMASGIKVSNNIDKEQLSELSSRNSILNLILQKRQAAIARADSLNKSDKSTRTTPLLTTGNQKVLCILMGFKNKQFIAPATNYENMWNQTGYNYNGSCGSIKDFYYENSYGLLNVQATVVGPYKASKNADYYSDHIDEFMSEAITAAKNDVQFQDFDLNGDKEVDAIHIIFAGYGQEIPGSYGIFHSHQGRLPWNYVVWQGLYRAKEYFCTPEYSGSTGTSTAPIGTVCHEYGHLLGAPDYYDLVNQEEYPGTGYWDLMGIGSWSGNGRCPAHHNPYTKAYIYNWVNPTIISSTASDQLYTLTPSHNTACFYRINTSTTGEFFLLENKKKLGFNSQIPVGNKDGLLIYHIHKDIQDAIDNHSVNTSHPQKCYIVNANATSNPNNSPSSYGTIDSLWAYPTNNKRFFTGSSIPSAISWAGVSTGVNIYYIQKVGNNIQFVVNPFMRGSATLCSSNLYYLTGIPSFTTPIWSYETNIQQVDTFPVIRLSNFMGTSVTVQRGTYRLTPNGPQYLYSGYVTLKAQVYCGTHLETYTKTLFMHEDVKPTLPASSLLQIGWQETRTFTINNCTEVPDNKLKWVITMPQSTTTTTYYGRSWTVTPTTPGTLNIKLYNLENCSTTLHSNYNVRVNFIIPVEPPLLSHPNPVTTSSVDIHIKDNSCASRSENENSEQRPTTIYYTLELWDDQSRALKSIDGELSGEEDVVTLDVSGLNNGIYLLTLKVDNQIVRTSKMIINQ